MGISTKKGDSGFTDLPGKTGRRVRKDDPIITCLGSLDELDAFCSLAELELKSSGDSPGGNIIAELRKELFSVIMPAVAGILSAGEAYIPNTAALEQQIAELEKENPIHGFAKNWTKTGAAKINAARTICRRAERDMATVLEKYASGSEDRACTSGDALLSWLNRLSDLMFLLAVSEEKSR